MVVPLSSIPPSHGGLYAMNNQFLAKGSKGFKEWKMFENEDLVMRFDFPGVPKDGVRVVVDPTKKAVHVLADAPKEHKHDSSHRNYRVTTGVLCSCCDISGYISKMSDGVLRLLILKTKTTLHLPSAEEGLTGDGNGSKIAQRPSVISFLAHPAQEGVKKFAQATDPHVERLSQETPNADALTARVLMPHPYVNHGSKMVYESKQLLNGGLYVRVDMPGVPKDKFTVSVNEGRVMVTGEAPAVSYDCGARFYSGEVAMLATPINIPRRRIKTIAKNGVIRLIIPPI